MTIALFTFGLLLLSFLVHLVWWHIRLPRRQMLTLLCVFIGMFAAAVGAAAMSIEFPYAPQSLAQWVHASVVYVPVALAYVATYSAIEEDSPTLGIVRFVADAGAGGRTREELEQVLNDQVLVGSRLTAMIRDGLVIERDGAYNLTQRGWSAAEFFRKASALVGIRLGG